MQSPSQCFALLFGFCVFPSFHPSGRAEGRVPAAAAAALCLALRVPHTLPPGSRTLAASWSSLLILCVKTWGLTPRRVQEHSPESRRVYCTEQEFLPGVVTKALNHQWELWGWLQLEEAVPRPRAAIWCRPPVSYFRG